MSIVQDGPPPGLAPWMPGLPEAATSRAAAQVVQRGDPSRSASAVAYLRAVHQLIDEPLIFSDPIALPVLDAVAGATLYDDPFAVNDPTSRGLRGAIEVRSRLLEDELRALRRRRRASVCRVRRWSRHLREPQSVPHRGTPRVRGGPSRHTALEVDEGPCRLARRRRHQTS